MTHISNATTASSESAQPTRPPNTGYTDEVNLCKGCNTMKHLNNDGYCGRCVKGDTDWLDDVLNQHRSETWSTGWNNDATERAKVAITKKLTEIEKAYGGCHNCYGKGYATVNDRWIGHDTDTDIGSPGGTVSGGDGNAMKFCICERGKQLTIQFKKLDTAARKAKS